MISFPVGVLMFVGAAMFIVGWITRDKIQKHRASRFLKKAKTVDRRTKKASGIVMQTKEIAGREFSIRVKPIRRWRGSVLMIDDYFWYHKLDQWGSFIAIIPISSDPLNQKTFIVHRVHETGSTTNAIKKEVSSNGELDKPVKEVLGTVGV